MHIAISAQPFDPWEVLRRYETTALAAQAGKFGAAAVFVGTMRDLNEGDAVTGMTLEHYPGMTEKHLARIVSTAITRWQLHDALVLHRVGPLKPCDPIVLVAVWSAHRAEAFEACRYIMEDLKSQAPFWKKETLPEGQRWVAKNTSGYTDA